MVLLLMPIHTIVILQTFHVGVNYVNYGKFEGYDKSHTAGIESNLKAMANNADLVPTNDLTLFLGKWQTLLNIDTSSGIYGPTHYVSVDFALNEINKRNHQAST